MARRTELHAVGQRVAKEGLRLAAMGIVAAAAVERFSWIGWVAGPGQGMAIPGHATDHVAITLDDIIVAADTDGIDRRPQLGRMA